MVGTSALVAILLREPEVKRFASAIETCGDARLSVFAWS